MILRIILALLVIAGAIFCMLALESITDGIRAYGILMAIISFAYLGFVNERSWDPLGWKPYSFEILLLCIWFAAVFYFAEKWDADWMRAIHFGMGASLFLNLVLGLIGIGSSLMVKVATLVGMAPIIIMYSPLILVFFVLWYVFHDLFD